MEHDAGQAPAAVTGRGGAGSILPKVVVGIAIVMQIIVLVPFTLATGLVAPLWAGIVFFLVWVAASVLLVVVARRRPLLTPLIPVANAVVLWFGLSAGEVWFGWTP